MSIFQDILFKWEIQGGYFISRKIIKYILTKINPQLDENNDVPSMCHICFGKYCDKIKYDKGHLYEYIMVLYIMDHSIGQKWLGKAYHKINNIK